MLPGRESYLIGGVQIVCRYELPNFLIVSDRVEKPVINGGGLYFVARRPQVNSGQGRARMGPELRVGWRCAS